MDTERIPSFKKRLLACSMMRSFVSMLFSRRKTKETLSVKKVSVEYFLEKC
jgi:hypothetical protein